jgi:hypothetical protein
VRHILIALSLALQALAGAAAAQSVAKAVQEFGLIGTWAIDCGKPAARDNIQVSYAAEGGEVILSRDGGPDARDSLLVRSARLMAPDLIETVERNRDMPLKDTGATEMTVVLRKTGGKIRIWKTTAAGMTLVDEGKVVGTGATGMAMAKCK